MDKHLLAVGVGLAMLAGAAQAADPVEKWTGSWTNTRGDKGDSSTILFQKNGNSDGDWDGFKVLYRTDNGNTRTWEHNQALRDKKGVLTYLVTATIKGDTMTVKYDVYDGIVLLGVPEGRPLYSGSGTFTRSK